MANNRMILKTLLPFLVILCTSVIVYAEQDILGSAKELAIQENKPILIEFVHQD